MSAFVAGIAIPSLACVESCMCFLDLHAFLLYIYNIYIYSFSFVFSWKGKGSPVVISSSRTLSLHLVGWLVDTTGPICAFLAVNL
jgi:hypothetical protein